MKCLIVYAGNNDGSTYAGEQLAEGWWVIAYNSDGNDCGAIGPIPTYKEAEDCVKQFPV